MKNKSKVKVLVLGGHIQGLGIVRVLGDRGLNIAVIDETSFNLARYSRYCNEFLRCSNQQIEDFLYKLRLDPRFENCVIFPTNDFYVELLAKNKKKLAPNLICAVEDWERIDVFFSKKKSYQLAKELSIDIAKTTSIESIDEITNIDIQFPCIIKPSIMHTFYKKFKKKVIICHSKDELKQKMIDVTSSFSLRDLLIQEIIQGDNSCQFSVGVFAIKGEIIRNISANRARQHPIDFGNATTMAITCNEPELIEIAKKIINETKYTGLCEIEFKKDSKSGKFMFLEVNSRTWKWHSICEAANVELLNPYYEYLTSGKSNFEVQVQRDAYFRHDLTDLPMRVKMRLNNLTVINSPKGFNKQHAVWSKKDFLPWFVEKVLVPYFVFKR